VTALTKEPSNKSKSDKDLANTLLKDDARLRLHCYKSQNTVIWWPIKINPTIRSELCLGFKSSENPGKSGWGPLCLLYGDSALIIRETMLHMTFKELIHIDCSR
jgi:hypothetical protein